MAEGKWIPGLTPGMAVADAARVVLAARLEVVRQYLPLATSRPDEDTEYVHQLRVGTRRAAAALRVFADCLPGKRLRAVKRALRGIRQASGDARDWDVFLTRLPAHEATARPETVPAIDFLMGYALGERSAAQTRLVQAAADAGPSFAPDTAVLPAHVREPDGDSLPETFGDLATEQLGLLVRTFNTAVEANPDSATDLHQLRILGKQLRYAIELFVSCFAPPLKDMVYPTVEAAQEVLGELQDAVVGTAQLESLWDRLKGVIPKEWPRLEPGFKGLLAEMRQKIPSGRQAFGAWRDEWTRMTASHPLDAMRLAATQP